MRIYYKITIAFCILLLLLVPHFSMQGQERGERDSLTLFFPIGKATLDYSYASNGANINNFFSTVAERLNSGKQIIKTLTLCSSTSPEGPNSLNSRLQKERLQSIKNLLQESNIIPDSILLNNNTIHNIGANYSISGNYNISAITYSGGGKSQIQHSEENYNLLRSAGCTIEYGLKRVPLAHLAYATAPLLEATTESKPLQPAQNCNIQPERQDLTPFSQQLLVKTNAIGWALLIGNIAAEVPLNSSLSLNVPFYYSGANLFSNSTKFRMVGTMPELRYNFGRQKAFFIGAHAAIAWYNFAFGGEYRIQDAGGNHPALGGGISLGYRIRLLKKIPLGMEITAGAGVYHLKYDKFFNEPNGAYWQKGISKTSLLPESFAISLFYAFNIKRGGAR